MYEVVDGALQSSLDEVILQGLGGVLLQGLMSNEVGVGVNQAPLSADEVLIVFSLIGSQESIPLLLHSPDLSGVELLFDLEDVIQQMVYLGLGDLLLSHQNGFLLKLRDVVTAVNEDLLSRMEFTLDRFSVAKANLVCSLPEGQVELILTDDSERGDGSLQGSASTVGVLEDNVGGYLITHQIELRKLSDDVDELVVFPSLQELQTLRNHGVDEVESLDVLNNFELRANHSVGCVRVLPLSAEGPRNRGTILQEDGDLLHSVVEMGELQGLFNSLSLGDISSDVGPGSSTSSHLMFLLKFSWWFVDNVIIRPLYEFVNGFDENFSKKIERPFDLSLGRIKMVS